MATINEAAVLKLYLDTQEYSDRLAAIEAQAASSLATQKSEVAAAIAQANLTQSQTLTALTLEVSSLKTSLTTSITATQSELISKADQLRTDLTDIAQQLTQDSAAITQEIQDALDYLKSDASVASALRYPRKINGTDFDARSDITTNAWGATRTFKIGNKTISINGTSNVAYSLADIGAFPDVGGTIQGSVEVTGDLSVGGTISATLEGTAASADKLLVARKIQGVDFDGTQDISLPIFSTQIGGLVPKRVGATTTNYLREDGTWVVPTDTTYALLTKVAAEDGTATTANSISAKVLKDAILYHTPVVTNITGNAGTATKLQTSRTISLSGGVTGSVSFDGSANASIATTVTGLGTANGIATLDSNGQVPSTQLPSYVDDVLEYVNVAAFPTTGVVGKIYVETTGNTTYRWGGTAYVKITSGEVSSVAGKTGVVTLSKSDVGLANADNTADSVKNVASASKLTTARTIGGVSFDGTANINLPGVNTTGNQSTTGNATTATTLQTAHTINGTSFNGSANITTANWGTARTLTLGSTGKSVNGSADVSWSADEILPTGTSGQVLKHNGTSWVAGADNDTTYSAMSAAEATAGTATTARLITPAILKSTITALAPVQSSITGNAATATKLQTARTINGVGFDGSKNITLPLASTIDSGTVQLNNTLTSTDTGHALTAAQGKVLNESKLGKTENAVSASKLQTSRMISLTGDVTGSVSFDGSSDVSITTTINGTSGTPSEDGSNVDNSGLIILIKDSLRQSVEVASGGEQTVLYTAKGQPTYMNIIKKFDMSTIDPSLSGTHPAFIVDGVEKPEIFIGTYQGRIVDGELLSLPNVEPSHSIDYTNFLTAARANGSGHHLITNAEWSAVALQCFKDNKQPMGNTYFGRSSENPLLIGRRADGLNPGNTSGIGGVTLTGSGPVEWRHNGKENGIADLSGNLDECNSGMRIFNGEIQIIADNNAANHTIDLEESSTQWKAINGETGNLVTPDGNGTTVGTVKYANSGTADYTIKGASFGAIRNLSTTKPVTAAALAKLKALCLYPHNENTDSYNSDYFYVNMPGERVPIRGGDWSGAATAGVLSLRFITRSTSYMTYGSRPAYVNLG